MSNHEPVNPATVRPFHVTPCCANCEHSTYDTGDRSVGIDESLDCTNNDVPKEVFDLQVNDYAAYCGHYSPHPAGDCGQCRKPIEGTVLDVIYWCDSTFSEELVPACSGECALDSVEEADRLLWVLNDTSWMDDAEALAQSVFPGNTPCPHGNRPEDCDACMVYGDFLADCAREERHFGSSRSHR